jgi:two-component system, LytTR family, sensor kinase
LCIFLNRMQMTAENFFFSEQIFKYVLPITFFYLTAFVIMPLWSRKKYILAAALLLSLILSCIMRYLLLFVFLPAISKYPKPHILEYDFQLTAGFWWWLHYTVYGWAYWHYFNSLKTERNLRVTEAKNFELKHQKLLAEYDSLKNQINPHFLFNTLNFFYSGTWQTNPKVAEGIGLLAGIMQYSLLQGNEHGRAPLEGEWRQVNNFITLHQLRYNEQLPVTAQLTGSTNGVGILPHLLLTLVENAFKHGDINRPLQISLDVTGRRLHFAVINYKKPPQAIQHKGAGLGLANINNRLKYEYSGAALLEIQQEEEQFSARLQLPLGEKDFLQTVKNETLSV